MSDLPQREGCILVAADYGSVFLRFHDDLGFWTKATWMIHSTGDGLPLPDEGHWYESRAYADERRRLLAEHENSVYPLSVHPNVDADEEDGQHG